MIEMAIDRYVQNIPWDRYSSILFEENIEEYSRSIAEALDGLPSKGLDIEFESDIWDFSPLRPESEPSTLRINFSQIHPSCKDYFKFFVLYRMADNVQISTVVAEAKTVASLIHSIFDTKTIQDISLLTTDDVENVCLQRPWSGLVKAKALSGIANFFSFIKCNFEVQVLVDYTHVRNLSQEMNRKGQLEKEKTPTIPDEYFDKIKNACRNALNDDSLSRNRRMTAGLIIILTQTGLRGEDLISIRLSDIKTYILNDRTFNYIEFETRKPTRGRRHYIHARCRLNPLCMEAVKTMTELGAGLRRKHNTDHLYLLDDEVTTSDYTPPIKNHSFVNQYQMLMREILPEECSRPWEGIEKTGVKHGKESIYIPAVKQYRVFACTDLYRQGASLLNIRRSMGHLSYSMEGYYVRQKETWQEDRVKSARTVLKAVSEENTTPIGNSSSPLAATTIRETIKDLDIDIKASDEELFRELGNRLIIRAKSGGFCIRTGITCSEDYKTDQTLCAYDECPNLHYFYFNLPNAYSEFLTAKASWDKTKSEGHTRAAEKEAYKVDNICRRRIVPMLDELDRRLSCESEQAILERHPGLESVIHDKDRIREETESWLKTR